MLTKYNKIKKIVFFQAPAKFDFYMLLSRPIHT